ncbi:MAG: acyl-CoA/acyl-ACP dehydrogenase [Planctomycetaceae bacterium]|nr:acyl-CoA/acyl-ACP dehydrogenase [Planctomycetaceae bacterium]MCB9953799.1 acyl-CoA/acyl-ACP dehydrogenase [Planctomycetaceae bacterium]
MHEELLKSLAERAGAVDQSGEWPTAQLSELAEAGELGWFIPEEFGGNPISGEESLARYRELATACLTTSFILTQRNGACQRIANSENDWIKSESLADLASGRTFATVGISHLTTSRQHMARPVVAAEPTAEGFKLSGTVPWVTGAAYAKYVVTGAVLPNREQILVALPMNAPGVSVLPHTRLLSLTASYTAPVQLEDVVVENRYLLAGPVENVMSKGKGGGTGSLVTSGLAAGVAYRCLQLIEREAERREDLIPTRNAFHADYAEVDELLRSENPSAELARERANSLVLRISQAALAITKGAGFVTGHEAERAIREAMFFLVWSCPQPVVAAALDELVCRQ